MTLAALGVATLVSVAACSFDSSVPSTLVEDAAIGAEVDGASDAGGDPPLRVTSDLIALYNFGNQSQGTIADVSNFGTPLNLAVVGPGNYTATAEGWSITGDTLIRSVGPAQKIYEECSQSNALSVEAWIRPSSASQDGPARIAGMSFDPYASNFALVQGANNGAPDSRYGFRLRSEDTQVGPGTVVTDVGVVTTNWTHIVFTRASDESIALFVDGTAQGLAMDGGIVGFTGDLNNWNAGYTLNLADELDSDPGARSWHGDFALLAIYRRDLSPQEVQQNFMAGR